MARLILNNPSAYLSDTKPFTPTWTTADGGFPKNSKMPAINFCQGDTSTSDPRINALKSVEINGSVFTFAY